MGDMTAASDLETKTAPGGDFEPEQKRYREGRAERSGHRERGGGASRV
jgi:hypothetical protein